MNKGKFWTPEMEARLIAAYKERPADVYFQTWANEVQKIFPDFTVGGIRGKANELLPNGRIDRNIVRESPYPSYTEPLVMEGDALILPDLEFPFHHAGFVNAVLSLAEAWKIRQCIMAGDVLHFDSLSGWDKSFVAKRKGGLTEDAERELMEAANNLPAKYRDSLAQKIAQIGRAEEQDGMSTELEIARGELLKIEGLFDRVDFILGNHEGRLLRALETAINPQDLINLLRVGSKWRTAPYYFSYLDTSAGRYQIEHPKGAAESTAQGLAAKFHCHVIMGHSHLWDFSRDISGKYYAIHAGCCVDENRLPYASQRHVTKRAHSLGAVIVRNGYPWLLHEGIDWKSLRKMA